METTTETKELVLISNNIGVEEKTAVEIAKKFNQFFNTAKEWKKKIEAIEITSIEQKQEMKMSRDARLFVKNTRILAEKEKDTMRATIKERMSKDVAEDKFVVECFKLVETTFKNIEKIAQDKEDYAEKLEQERKDKLKAERIEILTPLAEFVPMGLNLAEMSEDDFSKLVNGANLQKEAKEQAEKRAKEEAEEKEKKVKLYQQRKELLFPYWSFLKGEQISADFSELPQESFDIILAEVIEAKKLDELEKQKQALEIEALKKQAEEQKAKADLELAEQKRLAEIETKKQEDILAKQKELAIKLADELKAKKDAEEKAKAEEEARLEAELNKGDADKFNDLIADLTLITTKYNFKSKKNQKIYADVVNLVNKTIAYANEKKI